MPTGRMSHKSSLCVVGHQARHHTREDVLVINPTDIALGGTLNPQNASRPSASMSRSLWTHQARTAVGERAVDGDPGPDSSEDDKSTNAEKGGLYEYPLQDAGVASSADGDNAPPPSLRVSAAGPA